VSLARGARRRIVQPPWIFLCDRDEFTEGFCRYSWIDDEQKRIFAHHGDRREVTHRVVGQLGACRGKHRERRGNHQQSVAVRRGPRDRVGPDNAAGRRPVFNDDGLPERLFQVWLKQPRRRVVDTAGRERHNNAHECRRRFRMRGRDGKQQQ
jgi:hypothetical protein